MLSGVTLGIASVAASLWVALSSGTPPDTGLHIASLSTEARPDMRLLKRPPSLPSDPRKLIVGEQSLLELAPERIAQAWNRSRVAAALSAAENEAATDFAMLLPAGVEKTARVVNFGVAGDPRNADVLRRAIAAAGTSRSERVAFIAPAGHGIEVRVAAGGPIPQAEASIEIAFVAPLVPKTTEIAAVDRASSTASIPTRAAALASAEKPDGKGGDPFGQVLASAGPVAGSLLPEDGPLPSAKPRTVPQPPETTLPMRAKSEPRRAPNNLLAYARPQNPLKDDDDAGGGGSSWFGGGKATLPGRGSKIAVYDISAGIVYMPNGEKLEASSGRGEYRDNPKFVHVRMRGSTPPNVYHLRMREALFHGIEAIRMTPVNQKMMFGRDGMLTHSYLLRRRGDSSGCVVFEEYPRFLNAFKRGEVKTLVVVPRISELSRYMAML